MIELAKRLVHFGAWGSVQERHDVVKKLLLDILDYADKWHGRIPEYQRGNMWFTDKVVLANIRAAIKYID